MPAPIEAPTPTGTSTGAKITNKAVAATAPHIYNPVLNSGDICGIGGKLKTGAGTLAG